MQVKVECQVDEQNQDSKIDLQTLDLNVKVELVEEASTLKFLDRNYRLDLQSKFKKYMDYCWIHKSIVQMLHQEPSRELRIK